MSNPVKQLVDAAGAADVIAKALPPTVSLSQKDIELMLQDYLAKQLAKRPNVYFAVKKADGTYMSRTRRSTKARLFGNKGAATQALYPLKHHPDYAGAIVVPVAVGEIKFELE